MTRSFVHSLDIAHDHRLAEFRAEEETREFAPKRGPSDGSAEGQPPPISDETRAAVNAGSIVSFVSGLGAEQMSDVLYSTQLAQRAASTKFDRFAQTKEWYGLYADVLDRLGWVGEGLASSQRDTSAGAFSMDKAALDVIAAVAAGGQLAILVKTLDALKKLGEGDRPLRIFDPSGDAGAERQFPDRRGAKGRQWSGARRLPFPRPGQPRQIPVFSTGASRRSSSRPRSAR
jgi:hypothetical protein